MEHTRETVRLETLSAIYDVPLKTLRKWASQRRFPGIIKHKGSRRLYVDLSRFHVWFTNSEDSTDRSGE